MYNFNAQDEANTSTDVRPLDILNTQVVYSLVPYTVGNHRDVTKTGCARELIECKACLVWPEKSKLIGSAYVPALGRGGAGPGVYTVMIVDHPKKKYVTLSTVDCSVVFYFIQQHLGTIENRLTQSLELRTLRRRST
jgi:hypothetical protein